MLGQAVVGKERKGEILEEKKITASDGNLHGLIFKLGTTPLLEHHLYHDVWCHPGAQLV
jgi:hypothetical protein